MARAKGTGTGTPRERGAYGNARGKHALARDRRRAGDKRVQTALEKVRAQEAALNARIAAEREAAALSEAAELCPDCGQRVSAHPADYHVPLPTDVRSKPRPTKLVMTPSPAEQEAARWKKGETAWSLGDARQMVAQGYSLARVVKRTGWGPGWLDDLPDVRP